MDSKLQKLLERISWDKDKYSYFEEAKIDKIIGNQDKTEYTFFINIKNTLPSTIFDDFIHNLKEGFDISKTTVIFRVDNVDEYRVQEYFSYLIGRYGNKCPAILTLIDTDVEIKDDTLIIVVNNMTEENKIYGLDKDIIFDFSVIQSRRSRCFIGFFWLYS